MTQEYFTTKEIAEITGTVPGTWHNWRSQGNGPKFFKIGGAVRYRLQDVQEWLSERQFKNAAQAKSA